MCLALRKTLFLATIMPACEGCHPYLACSPETIKDSSDSFRAFLGAILSIVKEFPLSVSSADSLHMGLDIKEEKDDGPLFEDGIDDDLGVYTPPHIPRGVSLRTGPGLEQS